jgi:signal peptidase
MLRTYAARVLAVVFVILTLALIVGPLIGQPVLLSFVTSGSMEPTIETGEAFVTIPDVVAGDVEVGDVVVFQAKEIQDGRLTTHRIVEETNEGYITQGDNNPFTDQGNDEPPVTEEQIVGIAWQPGGDVVTIPYVGAAVLGTRSVVTGVYDGVASTFGFGGSTGPQGPMLMIAALLILVAVGDSFREGSSRDWTRSRDDDDEIDVRYVAILLVLVVIVPANAAMLLPDTTQEVSMQEAAAEGNADPGEEIEVELSASNDGFVTMLFVLNPPSDVRLDNRQLEIPGGASTATTMYATVPPPGEERIVEVSQHRYIVLLPPSVLMTLHEFHPLAALGAINGMLVFGVLALVIGLAGARSRRARDTG